MFEELDDPPLNEVNTEVMQRIQRNRDEISALGGYRAERVAKEVERRGRGSAQEIAKELNVSPQTISRLHGEARKRKQDNE